MRTFQNPKAAAEPARRRLPINTPGDAYEQEADRLANQVMAGQEIAGQGMATPVHSARLQRFSSPSRGR